jgi:hypothetical protein
LWGRGQDDGPPRAPGAYAWFSDTIPADLPVEELWSRDGRRLIYVGIAPRASPGPGKDPMRTSLAPRSAYHYQGGAEASALRTALGIALGAESSLRLTLTLDKDGERFSWGASGEAALSKWMQRHLRVGWLGRPHPWEVSDLAFRNLMLPLNPNAQKPTAFQQDLAAQLGAAQEQARKSCVRPEP